MVNTRQSGQQKGKKKKFTDYHPYVIQPKAPVVNIRLRDSEDSPRMIFHEVHPKAILKWEKGDDLPYTIARYQRCHFQSNPCVCRSGAPINGMRFWCCDCGKTYKPWFPSLGTQNVNMKTCNYNLLSVVTYGQVVWLLLQKQGNLSSILKSFEWPKALHFSDLCTSAHGQWPHGDIHILTKSISYNKLLTAATLKISKRQQIQIERRAPNKFAHINPTLNKL